ncbi:hypothetical protein A1019T_02457 [Psychrobacter pasteurii]|uniref:Glycosyltransferase RgtA/B/C/D-like domain-containing protein n=1 Tax=Psychrobacter pasteurii TaxID=1945520 RepID=A0A1R4EJ34_9GAMM|nr:hypothetical protein [Psychrobacter pasteurii]SJM38464.1 hypothetical protein A1019T_02457 [Psychrobacter pasteurii]
MLLEVWQAISPFIILVLGLLTSILMARKFGAKDKRSVILYLWHTFFTFVYYIYTLKFGADATVYYEQGLIGNYIFQPGTHFIRFIVMILTNYFYFNMIGCFLFFNILGALGLIILDSIIHRTVSNQKKLLRIVATLVIFLPSISFWSSGIGKDPISFLSVVLALWSSLNLKNRLFPMSLSIMMMFFVRPHIAGILIISLAISLFFDKKTNALVKVLLASVTIGISSLLVPYALNYAGIQDSNTPEDIAEYIQGREDVYKSTDSGLTLSEMSFPMKLFTYMFRPTILEARSVTQIFSALDNILLLYLFIAGGYRIIKNKNKNTTSLENRKFMWAYATIAWIILALTTGNLGIAVRQKIMVLPFFLYLFISVMSKDKKFSDYYK